MLAKLPFSLITTIVVCFGFVVCARADESLRLKARRAVEGDAKERARAAAHLRASGRVGLEALFEEFAEEIKAQLSSPASAEGESGAKWRRIAETLDAVSQQKDSFASRLYWHTDIEAAKREARASKRPILSLRLLGNLSEEYSCANSRFFRTALYSNAEVSKYLRERFVLHWKTVRPAPVVTVDYGDGRKLVRTITGNSLHYILDSEGRTVDALPGLYGPRAFMDELVHAESFARESLRFDEAMRGSFFESYYNTLGIRLIERLEADARRAGVKLPEGAVRTNGPGHPRTNVSPSALVVAPLAVTKAAVELDAVRAITYTPDVFMRATDDAAWTKIAELHAAGARMDAASRALLARHNPYVASGRAATDETARVVRNFESRMALDTVRNEYLLRPVLLRWLRDGAWRDDVEKLNARVYAELFLTPDTDPWLGLLTPDTYTGLSRDGVVLKK